MSANVAPDLLVAARAVEVICERLGAKSATFSNILQHFTFAAASCTGPFGLFSPPPALVRPGVVGAGCGVIRDIIAPGRPARKGAAYLSPPLPCEGRGQSPRHPEGGEGATASGAALWREGATAHRGSLTLVGRGGYHFADSTLAAAPACRRILRQDTATLCAPSGQTQSANPSCGKASACSSGTREGRSFPFRSTTRCTATRSCATCSCGMSSSAAHAAEAYARLTGKPGVCVATSGPGATNLMTGLTAAKMDSTAARRHHGAGRAGPSSAPRRSRSATPSRWPRPS